MVSDKVESRESSSLTSEKILMTYRELSEVTSISRSKLEKLVSKKGIPFVKIGKSVRFEVGEVSKWLKKFRSRNVS